VISVSINDRGDHAPEDKKETVMRTINFYTAAKPAILFTLVLLLHTSLSAQTDAKKETSTSVSPTVNTQTVNAQQSGSWTVGIDQTKNTVQLSNSQSNPLPVKLVDSGSSRKLFQTKLTAVIPAGGNVSSAFLQIPAGKRLVIENVSAVARSKPGSRMSIQLLSYFDDGDGVGDYLNDLTFHRMALTDQGIFNGAATSTANHKTLIFADELIGITHFSVVIEVRIDAPSTESASGQVTLSGYVEDLPTP
jgi:hypothetical protein